MPDAPWSPRLVDPARPTYLALADAIAADVARGRLRQGDRLPTHRALAATLQVTPRTVARAYSEAERRGLVSGLVGSGTYVRAAFGAAPPTGALDLASLHPPIAETADPAVAMRAALATIAEDPERLARVALTEASADAATHRESAAAWVAHGAFRPGPEAVALTAGAQHALTVALLALEPAGRLVVTGALTNPGLVAAARALGMRLLAVDADEAGVQPDALDGTLRETGADVVHLQPTLANPTGRTAPAARRAELAEVVLRHRARVLEDDSLAPLAADRPDPVATLLPDRTCHVSSAAKVLALGLRVGVLVTPPALREAVAAAVRATTWLAAPLPLEVLDVWVRDGTARRLVEARRAAVAVRRARATSALPEAFAHGDHAAPHAWLALPTAWSEAAFTAAALERGVAVSPGAEYAVGPDGAPAGVRVGLNDELSDAQLDEALTILATLLRSRT